VAGPAPLPSFSIVIPTYQRRDVVAAAIEALCRTDYEGEIELIVVVDGSTDGTAERLGKLDCRLPLKIIDQPNGGAAHARNRGASKARHDVLLFLDDDMICDPGMVAEHARSIANGADAVIGETLLDPASPPGFMADAIDEWLKRKDGPLTPFDVWSGQLSVRRPVFEAICGFDEAFTSGHAFANEDADFGVALLAGYDVRHNRAAISRQRYVVSPRLLMDRAPGWVAGDLRLSRKHPALTRALFEARGVSRPATRFVYRPLSRIPLLPRLLAAAAVPIATLGLKSPLRSNRLLSRFFLGSRALSYWTAMRRSGWFPASDRLLVLGYHAIEDMSDDPVLASYGVPAGQLAEQLDQLARGGFKFVTPGAAAAFLLDGAPLPRRAVLLTFDDCYAELPAVARDILKPRSIEAIAFCVTALDTNAWDQPSGAARKQLLTAEELKSLPDLGVEIGSHGRTHPHLGQLSDVQRTAEIAGSASDIAALGLPRPRFFAYPYGEVDPASRKAVADAGYAAAFGVEERWADRSSDRFDLPRIIVRRTDRGWRFSLKISSPARFERLVTLRNMFPKRRRR
jgi:glycosyltransferase involved in cell wall biosynthesis/peptidoglycan/xylan/chitin deacetylase (PgdA/CDA1 family)